MVSLTYSVFYVRSTVELSTSSLYWCRLFGNGGFWRGSFLFRLFVVFQETYFRCFTLKFRIRKLFCG